MLVIEEPAPAEEPEADTQTDETSQPTEPAKKPPPKPGKRAASLPAPVAEEPLFEPPPLEPANNPGEGRRQQLEKTQHDMGLSIEQFVHGPLSAPERRTLAEAQAFLDQSTRALKEGDLPRAEKLAEKARLLVSALERQH